MNKKYKKYINYIVNDIKPPYFINMKEMYGLRPDEYPLVLSKVFNQPVTIRNNRVYNTDGKRIYYENSNGYWAKREYDANGNEIYYETSNLFWRKSEYDTNGNLIYSKNSNGDWAKHIYNNRGNEIYYEDSDGVIRDYSYE